MQQFYRKVHESVELFLVSTRYFTHIMACRLVVLPKTIDRDQGTSGVRTNIWYGLKTAHHVTRAIKITTAILTVEYTRPCQKAIYL